LTKESLIEEILYKQNKLIIIIIYIINLIKIKIKCGNQWKEVIIEEKNIKEKEIQLPKLQVLVVQKLFLKFQEELLMLMLSIKPL
jgi:hypothetical protein